MGRAETPQIKIKPRSVTVRMGWETAHQTTKIIALACTKMVTTIAFMILARMPLKTKNKRIITSQTTRYKKKIAPSTQNKRKAASIYHPSSRRAQIGLSPIGSRKRVNSRAWKKTGKIAHRIKGIFSKKSRMIITSKATQKKKKSETSQKRSRGARRSACFILCKISGEIKLSTPVKR